MEQNIHQPIDVSPARKWSNRILAASLFGIFFFTLFPYSIDFSAKYASGRSPFLLGGPLRFDGILHTFLNALLFMSFGFALSQFFAGRRKSFLKSITVAVIAGTVLSYSIEILQLYIPSRDSAWDDVLANTFGSLAGAAFGSIAGQAILRAFSGWENQLENTISLRKLLIAALIYFGLWFAVSIPLQQKTHLNNWASNSYLIIGYDAKDGTQWSGAVSRIQLWDRALFPGQAIALTKHRDVIPETNLNPLAVYDLSQRPPIAERFGRLPNLALRQFKVTPQSRLDSEHSVLMSEVPQSTLSSAVRQTNQLAVLVDCAPGNGSGGDGVIFAISDLAGETDFVLRQENSGLVIDLRNGLDSKQSMLAWFVSGVFATKVPHSIIFSYDGARGSLYIDGAKERKSFYLSPGAGLVEELIRIKTTELVAYSALFNSLVFLPIGFLMGMAGRIIPRQSLFYKLALSVAVIVPAILLESLLVWISGRQPSPLQLSLSIILTIAGMVWMNLDAPESAQPSRS